MVADGIAPEGVSQYKEQESATIFLGGDAVFMRNVPRMYALASDPAESEIEPAVIGVAPCRSRRRACVATALWAAGTSS
jgi:multiple sugar transport system substrate-binding protein